MPNYRGKYWCFTINNPTEDEEQWVADVGDDPERTEYLVVGRETGANGTPHLQGYWISKTDVRLTRLRALFSPRGHYERAHGTPEQASQYCKKEGDFDEYGAIPVRQPGKRTDWDRFREWVEAHPTYPTDREVFSQFPGIFARHRERIHEFISLIRDPLSLSGADTPNAGWQEDLWDELSEDPDDRKVIFIVDADGNKGKSWFCRYGLTEKPDEVQVLCVGKRDDLAHSIDPRKSIFLFDIPRGQMEFLQYPVLEMLKNRMVYSPKYASQMKFLLKTPHVVVFSNEHPDEATMSADRYEIKVI